MFYPFKISKTENGRFVITLRDIPECVFTEATEEKAVEAAGTYIPASLEIYYRRKKKAIPLPSAIETDEFPAYVPLRVQAKILLWNFAISKGMNLQSLADYLGISPSQAQRLVDLSKDGATADTVEDALEKLGGQFTLTSENAL